MGSVNERTEFLLRNLIIANGGTKSVAIENPRMALVGVITPAAMTGTSFSFEVSPDGSTYYPVYLEDGTLYSVPAAAGRYFQLSPGNTCGFQWVKLVSNAAEGAERTFIGVFRVV